jgi:hypothetical protein
MRSRAPAKTAFAAAYHETFTGIRPLDVPAFIAAQGVGATAATILFRWLVPSKGSASVYGAFPFGETGQ